MSDFKYQPPQGLHIQYTDRDLVIVNKPPGLLSVPGKHHKDSALTRAQHQHGRLYAVHRLDMDTSGLLIFAKKRKAERHLHAQFRNRSVEKVYVAVVVGTLKGEGVISVPLRRLSGTPPRSGGDLDGREAVTAYRSEPLHNQTSRVYLVPKQAEVISCVFICNP